MADIREGAGGREFVGGGAADGMAFDVLLPEKEPARGAIVVAMARS